MLADSSERGIKQVRLVDELRDERWRARAAPLFSGVSSVYKLP